MTLSICCIINREKDQPKPVLLWNIRNIYNRGLFKWGRSSVWLERRPVTPEVASSSLVGPVFINLPGSELLYSPATGKRID